MPRKGAYHLTQMGPDEGLPGAQRRDYSYPACLASMLVFLAICLIIIGATYPWKIGRGKKEVDSLSHDAQEGGRYTTPLIISRYDDRTKPPKNNPASTDAPSPKNEEGDEFGSNKTKPTSVSIDPSSEITSTESQESTSTISQEEDYGSVLNEGEVSKSEEEQTHLDLKISHNEPSSTEGSANPPSPSTTDLKTKVEKSPVVPTVSTQMSNTTDAAEEVSATERTKARGEK